MENTSYTCTKDTYYDIWDDLSNNKNLLAHSKNLNQFYPGFFIWTWIDYVISYPYFM